MAASSLSTAAYLFNTTYTNRMLADAVTSEQVFLNNLAKEAGLSGKTHNYKVRVANPTGIGATYPTGTVGASAGVEFAMLAKTMYGLITINHVSQQLSKDEGARRELAALEIEGAIAGVREAIAHSAYRNGSGIRGKRASASTNVITLSVAGDVLFFQKGMVVGATSNADGTSPRTGTTSISGRDPDAGTITLTDASQISGFSDNDYILRLEDAGVCLEGLAAIIPDASPSSATFRGVDRTSDIPGAAGLRISTNTNGLSVHDLAGSIASKVFTFGKMPDVGYCNVDNFFKIATSLNAKRVYDDAGADAESGFQALRLHYPGGSLKMYADPFMRSTVIYVGNMEELALKHAGGTFVETVIDGTGQPAVRSVTADESTYAIRSISNLICYTPSAWGVATL